MSLDTTTLTIKEKAMLLELLLNAQGNGFDFAVVEASGPERHSKAALVGSLESKRVIHCYRDTIDGVLLTQVTFGDQEPETARAWLDQLQADKEL